MNIVIELKLDGLSLSEDLKNLSSNLLNLEDALHEAGQYMVDSIHQNFASQGRPDKWAKDSPATVKRKGHGIVLVDSGTMMDSVSYRLDNGELIISCPVDYAGPNQDGHGTTPARPFMMFQDADVEAVKSIIERHLSL